MPHDARIHKKLLRMHVRHERWLDHVDTKEHDRLNHTALFADRVLDLAKLNALAT